MRSRQQATKTLDSRDIVALCVIREECDQLGRDILALRSRRLQGKSSATVRELATLAGRLSRHQLAEHQIMRSALQKLR